MLSASRLNSKVDKYLDRYGAGSARAYLMLAWWCLRQAFLPSRNLVVEHAARRPGAPRAARRLQVGFSFNGGIGDCLIQSEYVRHFVEKFFDVPMRVTVFSMKSQQGTTSADLFRGATFIDEAKQRSAGESYRSIKRFDVFIQMDRFPQLVSAHLPAIEARAPALAGYLGQLLEFQKRHRFIVCNSPRSDMLATQLCRLIGKTRYTGPDILGVLGMKDNGDKFMELDAADIGFVTRMGLFGRPYLTIQRGADHDKPASRNVRLWSVDKYNGLVARLKSAYPALLIVQMGYSTEACDPIVGVDLDLRGKTSLGELKALLKYATLHVDYEGGYAHIREFLHAPALVLFGPTSREFLGYPRHVNISSNACIGPCEWVTEHWSQSCVRGFENALCMDSITVEQVMAAASRKLDASVAPVVQVQRFEAVPASLDGFGQGRRAFINLDSASRLVELAGRTSGDMLAPRPEAAGRGRHSGLYNVSAENDTYDTVFASIACVEDYPGLVVRELVRVLKPGGTLVLETGAVETADVLSAERRWRGLPCAPRYLAVCKLNANRPTSPHLPRRAPRLDSRSIDE